MKPLIIILTAIFSILSVNAQDGVHKWSLKECIDYAVENNIEIRSMEISVDEAGTELSIARNSRLPDFNIGASQSFNFGQAPVRKYDAANNSWYDVYEDTQTATSSFSASSSIPIFAGGRITHQIKSQKFSLLAALENLEKAKQNLEIQVTSYYLDLLFKKELARTYATQLDLTEQQVEQTLTLAEIGNVPQSQYLDIQAQAASDKTNLVIAQNDLSQARLNLAHLLNITDIRSFDIEEPDLSGYLLETMLLESPDELYETAIAIKPHISEVEARLESNRYTLKATKAELYPTLSLGVGYSNYYYYNYSSGAVNESFRRQFKTQGNESVGLNLNIPIFNRFNVRDKVKLARYAISRLELELENTKLVIHKEINQAYESAVAAAAKYQASDKALQASQEAYDYAQQRYEVGRSTVFELNEAQVKLLISKSEQLQAKYDYIFRTKILDFYKGIRITLN